jgi:HEPN domain-containing protein
MNYDLGETDYRRAGAERLAEALILYQSQRFAGCVYLAGRAVESMLRAVIWKFDNQIRTGKKSLETGHDLRQLLTLVINLGVLHRREHRDELAINVQRVGRLWVNNMRFVPTERMKSVWWKLREIGKRRSLKQAVADYYKMCSDIVNRCEGLCRS